MARTDPSKGRKAKAAPRTVKPRGASALPSSAVVVDAPQDLHHMIAEAAYYRAQKRGFCGGDPMQDWLEAEAELSLKFGGLMAGPNGTANEFGMSSREL